MQSRTTTQKTHQGHAGQSLVLPAEIVDEKTNEFKIIDGFASCRECFATKEEQSRAQKYLRERLEGIVQSAASSPLIYNDIDDDHDHDNEDYFARYVDNPPTSRKQDEVSRYLNFEHRERSTHDILKFWKTMAKFLPLLTKLALQVLAVPAASASVERSFSAVG